MSGDSPIRKLERAPDEKLIETLERMLAEAKSGAIRGVVACSFGGSGPLMWQTGYFSGHEALWSLEWLKHELMFGGK